MKHISLFATMVLFLLAGLASGFTVSGTVTNSVNGTPIVGAKVRLQFTDNLQVIDSALTGTAGTYRLNNISPPDGHGLYYRRVTAVFYADQIDMAVVRSDTVWNFQLVALPIVWLEGVVQDTADSLFRGVYLWPSIPVRPVVVTAISDPGSSGPVLKDTTDTMGRYRLVLNSGWTGIIYMDYPGYEFEAVCGSISRPLTTFSTCNWIGHNISYLIWGRVLISGRTCPYTTPAELDICERERSVANVIIDIAPGIKCTTDVYGGYPLSAVTQVNYGTTGVNIRPTKIGWSFSPMNVPINLVTWESSLPRYPTYVDDENTRNDWWTWMWTSSRDTMIDFRATEVVSVIRAQVRAQSLSCSSSPVYDIMGRVNHNTKSGIVVRSGKLFISKEDM